MSQTIMLPNASFMLPPVPAAQDCTYSPAALPPQYEDSAIDKSDLPFTGGTAGVKAIHVRLVGLQPGSNVTVSTCDLQDPYGPDMDVAVYTGGERMHRLEHRIACRSSLSRNAHASGREGSARGRMCALRQYAHTRDVLHPGAMMLG